MQFLKRDKVCFRKVRKILVELKLIAEVCL